MGEAELVGIGEAARQVGVATSTLRYYEDRALLRPARRVAGRRVYGRDELRRLAFIQMAQRLGFSLDTIAAVLDGTGPTWSSALEAQLRWLEERIARAEEAKRILTHARECPHEQPWQDCPYLVGSLDTWLDSGATAPIEDLSPGDLAPPADGWPDPPVGGSRRSVPGGLSGG